jgi:hypothetical protein
MCFDKTGTLTEEGLDVLGARSVIRETNTYPPQSLRIPKSPQITFYYLFVLRLTDRFSPLIKDPSSLLPGDLGKDDVFSPAAILYTMTTCHSLKLVSDEIIGDPLDAKMFEFTGWTFEEGGRIYEFIPDAEDTKESNEDNLDELGLLDGKDADTPLRGHYIARDGNERSGMACVRPPGVVPLSERGLICRVSWSYS